MAMALPADYRPFEQYVRTVLRGVLEQDVAHSADLVLDGPALTLEQIALLRGRVSLARDLVALLSLGDPMVIQTGPDTLAYIRPAGSRRRENEGDY